MKYTVTQAEYDAMSESQRRQIREDGFELEVEQVYEPSGKFGGEMLVSKK